MTLKQLILLVLFLTFNVVSSSQTKNDSLQLVWQNEKETDSIRFDALNKYSFINMFSKPEATLIVAEYHYQLAQEKKSKEQMIWALNNKANIYRAQRDNFDEAMRLFYEAETLATELNDTIKIATIQGNKGNVFAVQQNYLKATQYYSAALKMFQGKKNKEGEGRMLNNLGGVYLTIGSYDLALDYYKNSLLLFNERGVEDRKTALLYMNIGWIYFKQEKYDESIASYIKALKIVQENDDNYFVAACYSSLSRISLKAKRVNEASNYAKKSLEINKELDDAIGLLELNLTIAKITFETNIEAARIQAETIKDNLPKNADKEIKKDLYELLYKCYKAKNKLDLSLEMYELRSIYNDSIQLEKNNFAVAREAVKNDFELKLYENKLKNEKEQVQLELKQLKRSFSIISISALLIGFIIYFFIKKINRNRKKRDVLLEELEQLKSKSGSKLILDSEKFELKREDIETSIQRKLNETDWNVLNILLQQPEITNKQIAEQAFMSVEGISSSLRRMYDYFEIKDSKYKKIALLSDAIKRSNN